ncbi:MAG: HAD hydrolase-like protein, partial [Pusillimonas sp.]
MSKLVLFDFDGTLADTAPDMAVVANRLRERQGLPPLPFEALRPVTSQGARGFLRASLGIEPDHPDYEAHRQQFLADYAKHLTVLTRLFPGVPELLQALKGQGFQWGIVT